MEDGIKKIREELGWTKQELADYLGVSCRSIFRWESGDALPSKLALKQILQLQDDIMSGEVLPNTPQTAQNRRPAFLWWVIEEFYSLLELLRIRKP